MRKIFTSFLVSLLVGAAIYTTHAQTTTSFTIDYGASANDNSGFRWSVNKNFTSTDTLDLTYVGVAFDSLHDLSADTGHTFLSTDVIRVDSISLVFSHINTSGTDNSIIVSILPLRETGYLKADTTVLWSDTLTTTTSLTAGVSDFITYQIAPKFKLSPGTKFGVKVEFDGPVQDTFNVISNFTDNCGGTCAANFSPFYPNSYYYLNWGSLSGYYPAPSGGAIYYDCNGSGTIDDIACEAFYLQNHNLWTTITINPPNTAPVALNDNAATEMDSSVVADVQANDSDPEGDALTTSIVTNSVNGTATVLNGDSIEYTPNASFAGMDSLAYSVCDAGGLCDSAWVFVDVLNVGIDEIGGNLITIHPNPTTGKIYISTEAIVEGTVSVYNVVGEVVAEKQISKGRVDFDLSDKSEGIYLIKIKAGDAVVTKKVVLQK